MKNSGVLLSTDIPELELINRGKVRDIYDLGDKLLLIATDRISAYDVIMKQGIPNKGTILNRISVFWFDYLADVIPNHLITADFSEFPTALKKHLELKDRSMVVRKAKRIDIECVVRGYISGSGWNKYQTVRNNDGIKNLYGNKLTSNLQESEKLPEPIFTPAIKYEDGHDENININRFIDFVGERLASKVIEASLGLYRKAYEYAYPKGIIIADTKFEFGLNDNGELILIDEALTPDSSRFWSVDDYNPGGPQKSFDKQYLRDYLKSINWNGDPPPPNLPDDIIAATAEKYNQAYNLLIK